MMASLTESRIGSKWAAWLYIWVLAGGRLTALQARGGPSRAWWGPVSRRAALGLGGSRLQANRLGPGRIQARGNPLRAWTSANLRWFASSVDAARSDAVRFEPGSLEARGGPKPGGMFMGRQPKPVFIAMGPHWGSIPVYVPWTNNTDNRDPWIPERDPWIPETRLSRHGARWVCIFGRTPGTDLDCRALGRHCGKRCFGTPENTHTHIKY